MREWSVTVEATISTVITVWADSEEQAEKEALVEADNMDLNEWIAEDSYVVDVEEEE